MDMKNTTSRLRRTFAYPTDDSSNGGTPEVLDEEEQQNLIQILSEQNATTNQQYQLALLAIPILASIPYILALFRPPTFLIAMLGLSSLASTAFLLISLPPTETGIPLLDAWARSADLHYHHRHRRHHSGGASGGGFRPSSSSALSSGDDNDDDEEGEGSSSSNSTTRVSQGPGGWWASRGDSLSGLGALDRRRRRRRRSRANNNNSLTHQVPKSPLERHLPFLNMALCAILILFGLSAARGENQSGGDGGSDESQRHAYHHNFGWLGLGNLPALVYVVTIIAKVVMASVDPERELAALKYGYKGA